MTETGSPAPEPPVLDGVFLGYLNGQQWAGTLQGTAAGLIMVPFPEQSEPAGTDQPTA